MKALNFVWYCIAFSKEIKRNQKKDIYFDGDLYQISRSQSGLTAVGNHELLLCEVDESIWATKQKENLSEPSFWPKLSDDFTYFEMTTDIKCPTDLILENFVDCAHTGFVHEGIFRAEPSQMITSTVAYKNNGVLIVNEGEKKQQGFLFQLFNKEKNDVHHTDQLLLPHTVRVDYKIGAKEIISTSICTPVQDGVTRIFTRVYIKWPLFQFFVIPFVKKMTKKILQQDQVVLEDQAEQIQKFGDQFRLTIRSDAAIAAVRQQLKSFQNLSHLDDLTNKRVLKTQYKV